MHGINTSNSRLINNNYKRILIAAMLFWVLDVTYLMPNIILAHQVKESSLKINISGRQRALSQKMAKDILQMRLYTGDIEYKEQLKQDSELFDMTYLALKEGGETKDSRGNLVTIDKPDNYQIINTLNTTAETWIPYKKLIVSLVDGSSNSEEELKMVSQYSNYANTILLSQMNKITALEEEGAEYKANLIQVIQIFAIVAGLINTVFLTKNVMELIEQAKYKQEESN